MPRSQRVICPNNLYHVYNRGVEKRRVFYNEKDYNRFLEKMLFYKDQTGVKILSYSILPNHWHFLLEEPIRGQTPEGSKPVNQYRGSRIAKFISLLTNSYTAYFNLKREHQGRIFQGTYKSKLIANEDYLYSVIAYINLNPLKHKIVDRINDWPYTSYHDILLKNKSSIIYTSDEYLLNYREIIKDNFNVIKTLDLE